MSERIIVVSKHGAERALGLSQTQPLFININDGMATVAAKSIPSAAGELPQWTLALVWPEHYDNQNNLELKAIALVQAANAGPAEVFVLWHNGDEPPSQIPGVTLKPFSHEPRTQPYDLLGALYRRFKELQPGQSRVGVGREWSGLISWLKGVEGPPDLVDALEQASIDFLNSCQEALWAFEAGLEAATVRNTDALGQALREAGVDPARVETVLEQARTTRAALTANGDRDSQYGAVRDLRDLLFGSDDGQTCTGLINDLERR